MSVDQGLIDDVSRKLNVVVVGALMDGGQKVVKIVDLDGEKLVMKVVRLGASRPDAIIRARREVELLKAITNDHVVQVRSDLIEIGDPPIVAAWLEEYIDGEDVADLLGNPWPWQETRQMAFEAALGLSSLHKASVVHRDLSPSNVRRTSDGKYKILDPGFARHTLLSGVTIGGQPGTPGFMSPEHLNVYTGAPTPSSDIFVVGILMFTAAATQLPIPYTGNDSDYIDRLRKVEIANLASYRPDYPPAAVSLINRCLHRQPARRFRNGSELAAALEEIP